MPLKTFKYLDPVPTGAISPNAGGGYIPPPKGSGSSVKDAELKRAKKRIVLTRLLDDGLQTLGQMQVLKADGVTEMFKMTTVELPYRGNQNGISAIPVGKYLVRSYYSEKYSKCFWVYANEAGNWQKNSLVGNGYKRQAVLIHRAPNSGWLMGCIGPGLKFDNDRIGEVRFNFETREKRAKAKNRKNKYPKTHLSGGAKGNPVGTGLKTAEGTDRLVGAGLWSDDSDVDFTSFYMIVQNNPNGLLTGKNNASKIMNVKTGEPIFMGESTN